MCVCVCVCGLGSCRYNNDGMTTLVMCWWWWWRWVRFGGGGSNSSSNSAFIQVSQEERSIFWEVIVSVILSKHVYMNMCPFPNGSEIEIFECTNAKLLIRKRYYVYVLFLIPVFIVQVTELVQFIISVRKFNRQHQCTLQLV